MNTILDVSLENFEEVVVKGSSERPIVVEFHSPRSNASQRQAPLLAKLSQDLQFTLARVDTDRNPDLVAYFRLTSLPDVRVIFQGQMADVLTGMLSESQLRKALSKHFLSPEALAIMEVEHALEEKRPQEALDRLQALSQSGAASKHLQLLQAKALLALGDDSSAIQILQGFHEGDDRFRDAKALLELMDFHKALQQVETEDLGIAYQNACRLALEERYSEALSAFLLILQENRQWREEAARKGMLTLFGVLGPKHALTWEYRAQLNSILFI